MPTSSSAHCKGEDNNPGFFFLLTGLFCFSFVLPVLVSHPSQVGQGRREERKEEQRLSHSRLMSAWWFNVSAVVDLAGVESSFFRLWIPCLPCQLLASRCLTVRIQLYSGWFFMSSSASWIWQDHHVHFAEICSSSRSSPWVGPRWHHPSLPSLCLIGPTLVHRQHSLFVQRGSESGPDSAVSPLLSCASSSGFLPFRISRDESGATSVCCSKCLRHISSSSSSPIRAFSSRLQVRGRYPSPPLSTSAGKGTCSCPSSPGGTLLQPPPLLPMKLLSLVLRVGGCTSQPFRLPPLEILRMFWHLLWNVSCLWFSAETSLLISCHFSCPSNTFLVDCTFDAV